MNRRRSKKRVVITLLFILYMILFLFAVLIMDRSIKDEYQYNLVLFDEIKRYFRYRELVGNWIFLRNILGNVVGFIPLGMFWPYVFPKMKNPVLVTLVCFECSLVIEVIQLTFKIGSFDVDDLLLNTVGGILGCITYYVWMAVWRRIHVQKKQ
ncbi:MAG: VanZ family protein [Lachnospiraceae bacterium]|nr:VanZ family protein [Lachnospiraceae bacterium]